MEFMESLREELCEKIEREESLTNKEVIEISQELDKLICIYYKSKDIN